MKYLFTQLRDLMVIDSMNRSRTPQSATDVPMADLSHLYNASDPRPYYAAMGALDYQTPRHIQRLVRWCFSQRQELFDNGEMWAIDVGCGYATNAAGLRHGIDPQGLYVRYADPEIAALEADALHHSDRDYFASTNTGAAHIAGVDIAHDALMYGMGAGLLSAAFSDDLTKGKPSPELTDIIGKTAVVMESGVPIFILPYILESILSVATEENRPWLVTAPPRYTDLTIYHEILNKHGYVLQQAHPDSLPHRQFSSDQEKEDVIADQTAMGLDNHLEDAEGYIRVELYLARPEADAQSDITLDM
jgi:hypothetical protein